MIGYRDCYCLYRHTSPSGKVYIGMTECRPEIRWANGRGYIKNAYFTSEIKRYGWQNFQHDIILDGLSYDDAAAGEVYLIEIHDATNRDFGYNRDNVSNMLGKCSGSTRRKLSKG